MSKGSFSATAVSTQIVAADEYRDSLTIQKTNATQIAIGLNEAAVAGKGIQLINADSSIELRGVWATMAVYAIGNGGTGTYQSGLVTFRPGPYSA
jgi:hypothetical protein